MESVFANLAGGFGHVFQPVNFAVLVIGVVLGLLVAVLPGLTLVMGVVLALPFTYNMSVIPAIILLTSHFCLSRLKNTGYDIPKIKNPAKWRGFGFRI